MQILYSFADLWKITIKLLPFLKMEAYYPGSRLCYFSHILSWTQPFPMPHWSYLSPCLTVLRSLWCLHILISYMLYWSRTSCTQLSFYDISHLEYVIFSYTKWHRALYSLQALVLYFTLYVFFSQNVCFPQPLHPLRTFMPKAFALHL